MERSSSVWVLTVQLDGWGATSLENGQKRLGEREKELQRLSTILRLMVEEKKKRVKKEDKMSRVHILCKKKRKKKRKF